MIKQQTYRIPFTISGDVIIPAASAEEAQRIVEEDMGKLTLADDWGDLETWNAVLVTAREPETTIQ